MRLAALMIMCVVSVSSFAQDLSLAGHETPYGFILNKGQVVDQDGAPNNAVKYMLLRPGLNVQVRNGGFSYDTYTREFQNVEKKGHGPKHSGQSSAIVKYHRVDISFPGSNPDVEIVSTGMSADPINYAGEKGIKSNHFSAILYKNLYNGIDLKLYTNSEGAFEYDFIVRPGADPAEIAMAFAGQKSLSASGDKAIGIMTRHGELREQIPASYLAVSKKDVNVKFRLKNSNTVAFDVPTYDRSQTLVIDPQPNLLWASYYGGALEDGIEAITTDASNNVLVAGYTHSVNGANIIATAGVHQTTLNTGPDGFFAVFNSSGVRQLGTYYGGAGADFLLGIIVNPAGEIFVTGHSTSSTGFGLNGGSGLPYATSNLGGTDAVLAKFTSAGVRVWGTYFGGSDEDKAFDMFFDASNNPVIVGSTASTSTSSPVPLGMTSGQTVYGGGSSDGFIASFTALGGTRNFSTYFGGDGTDVAYDAMRDGSGNIYVAGFTSSQNASGFATLHQTTNGGTAGTFDGLIGKFTSGGVKTWATYYGGEADDEAYTIDVVPGTGELYVAGFSFSVAGISTAGSHQPTADLGDEGFITKFNTSGTRQWGTFYGGPDDERIWDIAESSGTLFVTGETTSTSAIATTGSYQPTIAGGYDAFVSRFDANGVRQWASYFGGPGADWGEACAIDAAGNFIIAGGSESTTGVAVSGHQGTYGGGISDGIIAKFEQGVIAGPPPPTIGSFTPASGPVGTSVTITGSNFESTAANNIVYFGATKATVTGGGASSLNVTVPASGTFRPISVTNTTGLTGFSSKPFVNTLTGAAALSGTSFSAKVDVTGFTSPLGITTADFDLDGKPDLVTTNSLGSTLGVARNTSTSGSITFAATLPFTTATDPAHPIAVDLDSDGKLDLLTISPSGTLSLLRNTSSGSITFGTKIDVAGSAGYPAVGDLDLDGKPEIVVANNAGTTVSVFRNTSTPGSITFTTPSVPFTVNTSPFGLAIADIDGDGKNDIVVPSQNAGFISVLRNTTTAGGSIQFATKVDLVASTAQRIALADFDGDGKIDIAVSQGSGNIVGLLRNTSVIGSITVAAKVDLVTNSNATGLATDDLDGDGKIDIVVTNQSSVNLSVFKNNSTSGSLSFGTKLDFTTGTTPIGVAIVDLDGDGKKDLAVSNNGGGSFSTLRNNITVGGTEPTNQPTNLVLTPSATTMLVTYTAASPAVDGYIVLRAGGAGPGTAPSDGTVYTVGSALGNATVVHVGAAVSFSDFGLTPSTLYHYNVYAYNGSGAGINYKQSPPLSTSATTSALATEPLDQPTFFTSVPQSSIITVYFNAAPSGPAGYIALRSTSVPNTDPVDGTPYSVGNAIGNAIVVAVGTSTNFSDAALTASTLYNYKIYSYNGTGGLINYRQSSPLTGSSTTLSGAAITEPTASPTVFTATPSSTSIVVSFTHSSPVANGYIAVRGTSDPTTTPVDNTTYTLGQALGTGLVVYFGSSNTFNDTGLSPGTQYFYRIYSYNGASTQTNYRLTSPLTGNSTTAGLATEPVASPTALSLTPSSTSISGTFTAASGAPAGYIVLRGTAAPDTPPVDGTAHAQGATLGNSFVVSTGSSTTFNDTGLTSSTAYTYTVYSFNGSGGTINYRQTGPLSNTSSTTGGGLATEPTASPTSLNLTPAVNSITGTFTAASGSPIGYITLRGTAVPDTDPVDGTAYTAGATLGNAVVVAPMTLTTFNDTGLASSTTYNYKVFSYNGSGSSTNYRQTSPLTGSTTTLPGGGLATEPTAQPTNFLASNFTNSSQTISFTAAAGSPAGYIAIRQTGSSPTAVPVDATTYSPGATIGTATVAYVGSATTFDDSGLSALTAYNYRIFSFNGSGTSINYLTTTPGLPGTGTTNNTPVTVPSTFVSVNTGHTNHLYTVRYLNANVGFAGGASGGLLKTTNGGAGWGFVPNPATNPIWNIFFSSATDGFAVGGTGLVMTTTNSGDTWTLQTTPATNDLYATYMVPGTSTGYMVGASGYVQKTTNGGTTWTQLTSATSMTGSYYNAVHFKDVNEGFVAGPDGIIKTTNGGTTWTSISSESIVWFHFPSATVGYGVGLGGVIVKTADGGTTWTTQDSGVLVDLWGVHFVDSNVGFAVGDEGTVLKTTNGGTTWAAALDQADASTTLYAVHFGSNLNGAVVGGGGFIGRAQAEPAAIVPVTNFKTEIDKGGATSVSITVPSADAGRVESVDFYVIGIIDDVEELDPTYIQPTSAGVGTYSVNLTDAPGDPIGYKYLFVVNYDAQFDPPRSVTTAPGYAYIKYAAPANELKLTDLKAGNTESDYQMISVPLVLSNASVGSVFNDEFGTYDRSVWRLFRISGTSSGATTTEMTAGSLEIGKAYWLITTEGGDVGIGDGKTFGATAESPFEYTLIDGFNPIGNPYTFNVNWQSGTVVKGLRTFAGSTWTAASVLEPFKGYFVESTTQGSYELPLTGGFNGGRTKRFDFEQNSDSWQLNIVIEQGGLRNEMGQIGMHPNATLGVDAIDERVFPMPELFTLPSLSIDRPEAGMVLEREVVPPSGNQIWEFTLAARDGSSEVTMRWDRALIASIGRDMYLFDEEQVALINMSTIDSHITKSNTRLKIITGDQAFVRSEVSFKNSRIGSIYPNPAGGSFFVPVAMPAAGEVQVRIFDLQGKEVASQLHFAAQGLQNISVSGLPEGILGLYLVTTETGNAERRVQKVIFK